MQIVGLGNLMECCLGGMWAKGSVLPADNRHRGRENAGKIPLLFNFHKIFRRDRTFLQHVCAEGSFSAGVFHCVV